VETISRSAERQWVEWAVGSADIHTYNIGLSHQDTGVGFNSIDYGICIGDGDFAAYEKGAKVSSSWSVRKAR
jgi:hypothetical protein